MGAARGRRSGGIVLTTVLVVVGSVLSGSARVDAAVAPAKPVATTTYPITLHDIGTFTAVYTGQGTTYNVNFKWDESRDVTIKLKSDEVPVITRGPLKFTASGTATSSGKQGFYDDNCSFAPSSAPGDLIDIEGVNETGRTRTITVHALLPFKTDHQGPGALTATGTCTTGAQGDGSADGPAPYLFYHPSSLNKGYDSAWETDARVPGLDLDQLAQKPLEFTFPVNYTETDAFGGSEQVGVTNMLTVSVESDTCDVSGSGSASAALIAPPSNRRAVLAAVRSSAPRAVRSQKPPTPGAKSCLLIKGRTPAPTGIVSGKTTKVPVGSKIGVFPASTTGTQPTDVRWKIDPGVSKEVSTSAVVNYRLRETEETQLQPDYLNKDKDGYLVLDDSANLTFFFVQPGTFTVTLSGTVDGKKEPSVVAKYQVIAPTPNVVIDPAAGHVGVTGVPDPRDPGKTVQVLGVVNLVAAGRLKPALEYRYSARAPAGVNSAGDLFVTQLIRRHLYCTSSFARHTALTFGRDDLDNRWFYPGFDHAPQPGDEPVTSTVRIGGTFFGRDSPNVVLPNFHNATYHDNVRLKTFFMYQPAGGVPVALQESQIEWSGTTSALAGFYQPPKDATGPTLKENLLKNGSTTLPTYTNVFGNGGMGAC